MLEPMAREATTGAGLHPADAASLLAGLTGERYELVGRLAGGETGAHEVLGPDGPLVVKWESSPRAKALRTEAVVLAERLRDQGGWPVPRQRVLDVGDWRFFLQEFMPGETVRVVTLGLADQLLDLHARRLGMATPADPSHWPAALLETLTEGGVGYCRHDSLRGDDGRTARLLARIEAYGRSVDPDDLDGEDVVHWDLHPGNLLAGPDGLSAIVDTDFAAVGDGAFDLVMLATASLALPCEPGVRTRLSRAAFEGLGDTKRRAYLAHLFVRFLDWAIRRGAAGEVEFWLARSDEMLDL